MAIVAVEAALMVLALVLCLPVGVFCLEVLLSLAPRQGQRGYALAPDSNVVVLIPAHNEEQVIAATLETLMPTLPNGSRILVVADNCSDRTAAIAREWGAEVVERTSATERGKGFALEFGVEYLRAFPPAAIVFLDADCQVAPQTVKLLAAAAIETQRPVQGLNLCDPDPARGYGQLTSGFAFRFKNLVRTLGLFRLAGLCHLTGTGMALPWSLVERVQFAGGNVVEDMQLGIDMALSGKPAIFLPAARVDSPLPLRPAAVRSQRTRWEHGHLRTLLRQTPHLLALAFRYRRLDLAWLALDLAIPPLSLLIMALAGVVLVSALAWLFGATAWPLVIALAAFGSMLAAVLIGWAAHCRQVVPLRALVIAPLYALRKLPIYCAFLLRPQQQWVRTERDAARA
jgi:cellulose synthase/poly-beta-1,6-N-acetylglucosamine synthase-like glycosyltransferase